MNKFAIRLTNRLGLACGNGGSLRRYPCQLLFVPVIQFDLLKTVTAILFATAIATVRAASIDSLPARPPTSRKPSSSSSRVAGRRS